MIVRGLISTAQQQKLLALEKLYLYPEFSNVRQVLLLYSNGAEDDFRSKSHLLWQSVRPKDRHLNLL